MIELIDQAQLSLEFTKEVFSEFCRKGYFSNQELIDFYSAEMVNERFSALRSKLE